jgi:outer membrane protein OmpA-like peptidoglycan-associated protein
MHIKAKTKETSMPRIILLTALAALCFTSCRASGDAAKSQPAPTTNVVSNKVNAAPTVEAVAAGAASASAYAEPSLVSLSAGAIIVKKPQEYGASWSAIWILDEKPKSGWATPKNVTSPQIIVIALPERTQLEKLIFDIAGADGPGRGAKDILVEVSDTNADEGFRKIAEVSLREKADNQQFRVTEPSPGRWVRLTVKNNHGSTEYTELMDFRATGRQLTKTPLPDVSGTYDSSYGKFHIRQQGTSVTGCYETGSGLIDGGVEGRVLTFTWREADKRYGPAIMVFSPDGKQMTGVWWRYNDTARAGGLWNGTRISGEVGSCRHWTGGVKEQLTKNLEEFGRARVYGINFDTDSDRIKDESKPTLDQIASLLKAKPEWKMTIEGHTDAQGGAEYNQGLSERRANAVKLYLQAAGIEASRLRAAGYGFTQPVGPNDDPLGRAQNRRVELIRQ